MSLRDYLPLVYSLLPRGKIWPEHPGDAPDFDALLFAVADEPGRVDADAQAWLTDFFPDGCTEQLEDWERILSLPDCGLALGSVAERRSAILTRLRRRGDPTLANIQTLANSFGQNAVVVAGGLSDMFFVGSSLVGVDEITTAAITTAVYVTYDAPQSDTLECALRHAVPIHITIEFTVI